MEASEAGRRIFWRNRWLLLILMILPAMAVVPLKEHQHVAYAATATIQGQGTTPDATTQVSAIESRVTAVATSPALVQSVLSQLQIDRDAVQLARHNITVTPLSSSAIMVMTVTDPSAQVAVEVAGSLATAVVNQLNELGVKDNPELATLGKTNAALTSRRDQLLNELNRANASNAATSVSVQSLLSQLGAAEQELATNEAESQQVLATLTTETGASVVSTPSYATGVSRHVAVDAALAALLGLVVGLLFATLREVIRPTVAQPAAGARELGAVLLGAADESRGQIIRLEPDLPERLNLASYRAGVLTVVLTGPGSRSRLASLAARLRSELPAPERGDARGARARTGGHAGDDPTSNGDGRRPAIVGNEHRSAGLATEISAARSPKPPRTVVTLDDIRLGSPPPDAALVVVLPKFAPHSALDQAADLGVTADWPILGVIGLRHWGWLASLIARPASRSRARTPDARLLDTRTAYESAAADTSATVSAANQATVPDTVPDTRAPGGNHLEGENE